jgi:hypothetical protein
VSGLLVSVRQWRVWAVELLLKARRRISNPRQSILGSIYAVAFDLGRMTHSATSSRRVLSAK